MRGKSDVTVSHRTVLIGMLCFYAARQHIRTSYEQFRFFCRWNRSHTCSDAQMHRFIVHIAKSKVRQYCKCMCWVSALNVEICARTLVFVLYSRRENTQQFCKVVDLNLRPIHSQFKNRCKIRTVSLRQLFLIVEKNNNFSS